jgi:hypothetical protein
MEVSQLERWLNQKRFRLRGCPQAPALLTVPTPRSNIPLDTGSPPFIGLPITGGWHRFCVCQKLSRYASRQMPTMRRKGASAINAMASFTPQSATASDTQSGTTGPSPRSGSASFAQETSLPGSTKASAAEKAMVKNSAVSTVEPHQRGGERRAPPRARPQPVEDRHVKKLRGQEGDARPHGDAQRHEGPVFAHDLRADQRTGDAR